MEPKKDSFLYQYSDKTIGEITENLYARIFEESVAKKIKNKSLNQKEFMRRQRKVIEAIDKLNSALKSADKYLQGGNDD